MEESETSGKNDQFVNRENSDLADGAESAREHFLCADAERPQSFRHASAPPARTLHSCFRKFNFITISCTDILIATITNGAE